MQLIIGSFCLQHMTHFSQESCALQKKQSPCLLVLGPILYFLYLYCSLSPWRYTLALNHLSGSKPQPFVCSCGYTIDLEANMPESSPFVENKKKKKNLIKTQTSSSDCFFLFIRFVCLCSFQGGDLHGQLFGQFSVLPGCGTKQCGYVQSPCPRSGTLQSTWCPARCISTR